MPPGSRGESSQSSAGSRKWSQVRCLDGVRQTVWKGQDQRGLRLDWGQHRLPQLHWWGWGDWSGELFQQGKKCSVMFPSNHSAFIYILNFWRYSIWVFKSLLCNTVNTFFLLSKFALQKQKTKRESPTDLVVIQFTSTLSATCGENYLAAQLWSSTWHNLKGVHFLLYRCLSEQSWTPLRSIHRVYYM